MNFDNMDDAYIEYLHFLGECFDVHGPNIPEEPPTFAQWYKMKCDESNK